MLHTYGVYDGQQIAELVDGLIFRHTGLRHATFQDLHDLSGKVEYRYRFLRRRRTTGLLERVWAVRARGHCYKGARENRRAETYGLLSPGCAVGAALSSLKWTRNGNLTECGQVLKVFAASLRGGTLQEFSVHLTPYDQANDKSPGLAPFHAPLLSCFVLGQLPSYVMTCTCLTSPIFSLHCSIPPPPPPPAPFCT